MKLTKASKGKEFCHQESAMPKQGDPERLLREKISKQLMLRSSVPICILQLKCRGAKGAKAIASLQSSPTFSLARY